MYSIKKDKLKHEKVDYFLSRVIGEMKSHQMAIPLLVINFWPEI